MKHKLCWLLYDAPALAVNRDYAALMKERGQALGLEIVPVTLQELDLGKDTAGEPYLRLNGQTARPDAVLSRMRLDWVSEHLEGMGIPVFNNSKVCRICNDKRRTHQFLRGLPMAHTRFLPETCPVLDTPAFPAVLKPACGHGGEGIRLINEEAAWAEAVAGLSGTPALCQSVAGRPGRDLRVYVLFGEILAGVLRTANEGIVSNFKKGGRVELHTLSQQERELAQSVIDRFEAAGAPLCMAGVDLLYNENGPIIGEVEDVVGSRMLYQTSDIDLVEMYLRGIAERIS